MATPTLLAVQAKQGNGGGEGSHVSPVRQSTASVEHIWDNIDELGYRKWASAFATGTITRLGWVSFPSFWDMSRVVSRTL